MLIAILAAVGSVALGASIALFPSVRGETLGRIRTFALIAAITVVVGHLLPEAAGALGPIALVLVVLGVLLPTWIEDLLEKIAGHEHHHDEAPRPGIGLEIGYAGLILHHIGDGVALYQYGASRHASPDVVLALASHTLPVAAVVVVQHLAISGRRAALLRAAGLAAATLVGIAVGAIAPELLDSFAPWIAALVSGLLLHVIAHELDADKPVTVSARVADLAAAAAGVVLPVVSNPEVDLGFTRAFFAVLLRAAPPLLVGLLIAAAIPARFFSTSPRDTIAVARAIPRPRWATAFVIASPLLRVEVVLVSLWFLGAVRTLQWVTVATVITAIASRFAGVIARDRRERPLGGRPALSYVERVSASFEHAAPWLLAGALAEVYAEVGLEQPLVFALGAVVIVAAPSYLAAIGLIPLAAALLAKGAPWGPVLAGLIVGPMVHVKSILFIARAFGIASAIACGVLVVGLACAAGVVTADFVDPMPAYELGVFSWIAAGALFVLFVWCVWRIGTRGLIAALRIQ